MATNEKEQFDAPQEVKAAIIEHLNALHELCEAHRLPHVVAIADAQDAEGKFNQAMVIGLYGTARTPSRYAMAYKAINEGIEAAMHFHELLQMQEVIDVIKKANSLY